MDHLSLTEILQELAIGNYSAQELRQKCLSLCASATFLEQLCDSLKNTADDLTVRRTSNLYAELGKYEECRERLQVVLPTLAALLANTLNAETSYQICRAIGNICCDSDSGRQILLEAGGVGLLVRNSEKLFKLFGNCDDSSVPLIKQSEEPLCVAVTDVTKTARDCVDSTVRDISVSLGCLCNVLDGYPPCQKTALDSGLLSSLTAILIIPRLEALHTIVGSILSSISDDIQFRSRLVASALPSALLSVLRTENCSAEVTELVLDILTDFSYSSDGLSVLATAGAIMSLISVLNNNYRFDALPEDVAKSCGNLLVELMADPICVQTLSSSDKDVVLSSASSWLTSQRNWSVKTVAALVIGNMAQDRESCFRIFGLAEDVPTALVNALRNSSSQENGESVDSGDTADQENSGGTLDTALQHQYAVVSALKNLAVDDTLRQQLIDRGLIPVLLARTDQILIRSTDKEVFPILAKLLALLRMCVTLNESAALSVVGNELLAGLLRHTSHPLLSRESFRLLILLIENPLSGQAVRLYLMENHVVNRISELLLGEVPNQVGALVLTNALWNHRNHSDSDVPGHTDVPPLLDALKIRLDDEKIDPTVLLQAVRFLDRLADVPALRSVLQRVIFPSVQKICETSAGDPVKQTLDSIITKLT